jgi:uncharacterized membrane protein
MTWFPWFSLFLVLVTGALMIVVPRLSRPDIYFGVTVDPSFRYSETGRVIGRRYVLHVMAATAVASAIIAIAGAGGAPELSTIAVGVLTLASMVALGVANRQMRRYSVPLNPVREASLSVRHDRLPGGLLVSVLPFLILAGSAVYMYVHWNDIPERFPVHYGLNGPDRWADRSARTVFGPLGMGAGILAMLTILNVAVMRSRRIALGGTAAEAESSFRSMNVLIVVATQYLMALIFGAIPLISAFHAASIHFAVYLNVAFTVVIMAITFVLVFRYGQGGTRLAGEAAVTSPPIGDRTPDERWKWGIIYYNPEDPAIMVEKRFGLGYTFNFANVWSWVLLAVLLAIPLTSILIFR